MKRSTHQLTNAGMQIDFHKGCFCSRCDHPSAEHKLLFLLNTKGVCVWKYKILSAVVLPPPSPPTSSPRDTVNCVCSLRLRKRIIICNDSFWCSFAEVNSCSWGSGVRAGGRGETLYLLLCRGCTQRARDAFCGLWAKGTMEITESRNDWGWQGPLEVPFSHSLLTQGHPSDEWSCQNHRSFSQHWSHWKETSLVL